MQTKTFNYPISINGKVINNIPFNDNEISNNNIIIDKIGKPICGDVKKVIIVKNKMINIVN